MLFQKFLIWSFFLSWMIGTVNPRDLNALPRKKISIQCNLIWKMTGVRLTAEIKTSASNGGETAQTLLRVTATNIRHDSFFHKLRNKKDRLNLKDLKFQN